jgi:hypothetical protein
LGVDAAGQLIAKKRKRLKNETQSLGKQAETGVYIRSKNGENIINSTGELKYPFV